MNLQEPFGVRNAAACPAPRRGAMRCALVLGIGLMASTPSEANTVTPAAQAPDAAGGEVIVNGRATPACAAPAQTQTQTGAQAKSIDYACLNAQAQAAAAAGRAAPPADRAITSQADTPSKVGTFSFSATHERMGQNLGHSAQPYRPPTAATANAIIAGRASK